MEREILKKDRATIAEKKIDAKELARILETLPAEERFKIYYMIKGVALINDKTEKKH